MDTRRTHSNITSLDFRRADFGLLKDLLSRVLQDKALEGKEGPTKLVSIQGLPPLSPSAWMNRGGCYELKRKKCLQRMQTGTGNLGRIQRSCPSRQGSG